MPIVGETYEGHYIGADVTNIFMETDYLKHYYNDLLTLKEYCVKWDDATTYIHIEGPRNEYEIYGNLTYKESWKGNNRVISLLGSLFVKFSDLEGDH